jgi:hypothetical protein
MPLPGSLTPLTDSVVSRLSSMNWQGVLFGDKEDQSGKPWSKRTDLLQASPFEPQKFDQERETEVMRRLGQLGRNVWDFAGKPLMNLYDRYQKRPSFMEMLPEASPTPQPSAPPWITPTPSPTPQQSYEPVPYYHGPVYPPLHPVAPPNMSTWDDYWKWKQTPPPDENTKFYYPDEEQPDEGDVPPTKEEMRKYWMEQFRHEQNEAKYIRA